MDYCYYHDNVLMLGMMNSGKTYNTRQLLSGVPKDNIIALDPRDEYADLAKFMRVVPQRPYDYTWIDDLIQTVYDRQLYRKVIVFDDIDAFIKYDRESAKLGDFFVDSSHIGHPPLTKDEAGSGAVILAKRPTNLDKRIMQGSRWIYLFKGCLYDDVKHIQETCSLSAEMLGKMDDPKEKDTYLKVDKTPLDQHPFLLIDNNTKTWRYRRGLKYET